jgi:ABC-type transport system substrate-binding protein
MTSIWNTAEIEKINLGLQPEIQDDNLVLTVVGETWNNPTLQESILFGIDWNVLVEEFFDPGFRVSLIRQDYAGTQNFIHTDTRQVPYDPGRANKLLKEAGYGEGFEIALVIPAEDEFLVKSAELIIANMEKIGIQMDFMILDRDMMFDKIRTMEAAGVPSILYDFR